MLDICESVLVSENSKLIFYASVIDTVLQYFLLNKMCLMLILHEYFIIIWQKEQRYDPCKKNTLTLGLPHYPMVSLIKDL